MSSERTESLASPPSSQTSATTTTTAALAPATQTPIQAADASELATCGGEQQTIGKFVTGADCKLPLESNSNLNINQNHHTPESTHSQHQQQHHQQTTNQNQNSNPNSNNNNNNSNHHNKQTSKSMDSQQMHVCRLCDKLLSSSSSLDRHMLTHSGERPFVCKRCHMTFTTNGNMHRHMRTHLHKDSLARQQQEQQLKSLAIGQTSHSTSSPPPVAPSTLTNNNLDNTLAKHQVPGGFSNPLVPQGSAEAAAAATTRPFGHRNSHLEETRTHSPQEPFSSNQFGATFKHQQQQQPIRTRRAHHQLQQQQQQQQQQLHHQSGAQEFFSTANQIAGNDNLLALSSQLGPHRHQHHLFNGNAGLTDLAQHSGAGSPAPIRLHSPAMAPESQSAAAAKFLRHQASLDPKALMMGALAAQGDQLGLESVKAVMLAAAAAAAAAAAVSQQQQQHSAGAKRSHPVDADHESNQDGDELARLSSASANGNEDDSDDRAAERPARFARGKRRKQVNPRSTRMAAAVQQAAAASTAGMSDSDGDQDEAEQARSVSSLSCDIRPARDLHSVYEANLRLKGGEPYQDDDEPLEEEFDDEDEDRELFESKLARRAHGRGASSLAGSTSENQMAGSEEDGDADYSDQEQDINLSGLETTMIKREQQEQDFNNNQDNDTNCRDVEAEEDDDGDGNESGPDDMSMLEGEHNGDNKRHEPTQFSIMQSDDDGEVDRDDDEDDDEASGSSCNVNMNLSDNTSNSANDDHDRRAQQQMQMHQHQQQQQMLAGGLPVPQLTTMNGEVIEDISQSYVKTANPNAARKGGKRNRHCYKCKLCTYSSVDRCTLVRHLRIHSGERPYICGICRYAFTTKANCERHVRKRHKKQYNSLGGAGGGGVKGSNGGGRSLIITDHTNHQTIPVKVNPVAAQTISQTLQRIQEKQLQHNSNSQADDEMDNIERIQSNQQHHQQQHHNNNHHNHHHHHHHHQQQQQQHSQPTRQQSHQQPSDHVNTRSNNETTTSLTTSGYKQNKRKHRNDETLADDSNHSAPYQRRRLTDKHADDLFSSTRLANGNILYNQPQQQQPNSFIAGQVAAAAAAAAAAGTGAEIPSTNELFANLMAQLQQVTNQHQDSTANGGAGETIRMAQTPTSNSATFLANMLAAGKTIGADGQRSLLIPKQLSQQFPQLHNLNSQTPFFIRRNPFDPFNPIDLAAQALDLSCKFQSK